MDQVVVSLCVSVQRIVTSKLASAVAEAMMAPAAVLSFTPKLISISSGRFPMLRSFSTTLFVTGNTLLSASSSVSFALTMVSPRAARMVPSLSGSSTSTKCCRHLPGETRQDVSFDPPCPLVPLLCARVRVVQEYLTPQFTSLLLRQAQFEADAVLHDLTFPEAALGDHCIDGFPGVGF